MHGMDIWIKKTKLNENKKRIIPSKACNPVQAHVIRRNNVLFTQKCVLSYAKTCYTELIKVLMLSNKKNYINYNY